MDAAERAELLKYLASIERELERLTLTPFPQGTDADVRKQLAEKEKAQIALRRDP